MNCIETPCPTPVCRRPAQRTLLTALVALLCFCLEFPAAAHTIRDEEFICPIDGHKFSQWVSASGTQWGSRLDNKPLGPIAAPWDLPQCPKCQFVLGESAYPPAMLAQLKSFVPTQAYRSAASNGPTYLCLALLRERGAPPMAVGDAYLKASWQVEKDPVRSQEYLSRALASFVMELKALNPEDRSWACLARLCGELERRLGQFDAATARLVELRRIESSKPDHDLIDRQLQFIAQGDSAPHATSEKLEHLVTGSKPVR